MITWPAATLDAIIAADDLHIAPYRPDGVTTGTPTWIWCVNVDGELYVRAYTGVESRWYQAALQQGTGRITAAGATYEVTFAAETDDALNDRIDEAYRAKYRDNEYTEPMCVPEVRAATVRIRPAV